MLIRSNLYTETAGLRLRRDSLKCVNYFSTFKPICVSMVGAFKPKFLTWAETFRCATLLDLLIENLMFFSLFDTFKLHYLN